jgi:hypothetical protein
MTVRRGDEACRHLVAEERDGGGMGAIGDDQGPAVILGGGERRYGETASPFVVSATGEVDRGTRFETCYLIPDPIVAAMLPPGEVKWQSASEDVN